MIIHVVQPGETARSIANYYRISEEWLITENLIQEPNNLVVGAALVILFPKVTHTIIEGDTLENLATFYNVTVMDLLRNNPFLSDQDYLRVGDTIIIEYEVSRTRSISVFRYCYHTIDIDILKFNLPFLTYLIIYSYVIEAGRHFHDTHDINGSSIIEYAKSYGVGPIMQISFAREEDVSEADLAHEILNDEARKQSLIEDIISTLTQEGYSGIGISPIYIYPNDRQLYIDFIVETIDHVKALGLIVVDTIVPDTFELITDIFDTHNYMQLINNLADFTIIFPISVGIKLNTPLGSSNYNAINDLIEYFLEFIPAESMELGINTVGYVWKLPYIPCVSEGSAISLFSIMQLARDYSIPISFDERNQAAYLIFQDNNREYLMRFRDARSFVMYMDIVDNYNLEGIGVWNAMSFITPLWHIVNANYYINKVEL